MLAAILSAICGREPGRPVQPPPASPVHPAMVEVEFLSFGGDAVNLSRPPTASLQTAAEEAFPNDEGQEMEIHCNLDGVPATNSATFAEVDGRPVTVIKLLPEATMEDVDELMEDRDEGGLLRRLASRRGWGRRAYFLDPLLVLHSDHPDLPEAIAHLAATEPEVMAHRLDGGCKPLPAAVGYGFTRRSTIRALIAARADVNEDHETGKSALQLVFNCIGNYNASTGNLEELLREEAGADPAVCRQVAASARNDYTAYAEDVKCFDTMVEMLREAGTRGEDGE